MKIATEKIRYVEKKWDRAVASDGPESKAE
jgi:hypothetical protein